MAEIDWRKNSVTVREACLNVIDSLISDEYTYLNFDINDMKEDPDAPKSQVIMALVVKVAGGNRTIAANNIQGSLKKKLDDKKFEDLVITKGGNRLDVYLKYDSKWGVVKSTGKPVQKRIVLAVKPEGASTAGSGGGARETRRNECAQCLYADMVFNQLGRPFTPEEISGRETDSNLIKSDLWSKAYSSIAVDDAENEIVPSYNVLEFAWRQSHMRGANKLYSYLNTPSKGTYKFYRGKEFDGGAAASVSTAYKRANNNTVTPDNTSAYFSSEDKWNPADIWAIHKDYPLTGAGSISEKGKNNKFLVHNFQTLNSHVRSWFLDNKKLVGISLKKHEGSNDSDIKVINEDKDAGWDKKIWDSIGDVKKNDWFFVKGKWDSSMDVYIRYAPESNKDFQCRNFGGGSSSSWQLELSGADAKQGRCGGGVAISSIKDNGVTFPRSSWGALTSWSGGDSGNTALWAKCKDNHKDFPKVLDDIVKLMVKHFGNKTGVFTDDNVKSNTEGGKAARADMMQDIREKNQSWRYSKLLGLCFIDAISESNADLSIIIRDLYLYASSQTVNSGLHVKLT